MIGGKRGGKAAGGSGGGGRRPMSRDVTVSKKLSWVLRHGASQVGLKMHSGGWVVVADLLDWREARSLKITFAEIMEVVQANEKKRFQVAPATAILTAEEEGIKDEVAITDILVLDQEFPDDPAKHLIRATQGHSLKGVEASDLLTKIKEEDIPSKYPELVVHGTNPKAWENIQASGGMKPMTRQHMHFAARVTGGDEKVVSGMRSDSTILIWVNTLASMAEMEWWVSANNVILTSGVDGLLPLKYIEKVERRRKGMTGPEIIWSYQQNVLDEQAAVQG